MTTNNQTTPTNTIDNILDRVYSEGYSLGFHNRTLPVAKRLPSNNWYAKHAKIAINKTIMEATEKHFQAIVPDEGPLEGTPGTYADGYAKAIEDVCNAHYEITKKYGRADNG